MNEREKRQINKEKEELSSKYSEWLQKKIEQQEWKRK